MNIKQSITEAVSRGGVAVWTKADKRRMEVGRGINGYRVAFSTGNTYLYGHTGLTLREAVSIANRWVLSH